MNRELPRGLEGGGPMGVKEFEDEGGGPAGVVDGCEARLFPGCRLAPGVEGGLED